MKFGIWDRHRKDWRRRPRNNRVRLFDNQLAAMRWTSRKLTFIDHFYCEVLPYHSREAA